MATDPPQTPSDAAELLNATPAGGDPSADTRRRLALRAWRDWPTDLPSEIAPPPGVSDPA